MNLGKLKNPIYPLVIMTFAMFVTLVIALGIVIVYLNPPMNDLKLMFLFMLATGGSSISAVYLLYRHEAIQQFNSLRWTLIVTILLTVLLIFVNVWVTAKLMFISYHDLILTTVLLVFAGMVAVIANLFISNAWIERIDDLVQVTQRLSQGDLSSRLQSKGNDELAQLAAMFNRMAEALESVDTQKRELEQARRDLIAWVSHDLRTPLASIRAMNESIIDGIVTDPQTITRYTQTIQRELHHLSHLIDDLFELSQIDIGHLKLVYERASLRDMISDTLGSIGAQATQMDITLQGTIEPDIDLITVAPDKIQRVLYNLLDNALRHTPTHGKVSLKAVRSADGKQVEISVHNTGNAIPVTDLPHIFKSFYRGEPSRAQGYNGYRGTGLGLAIVRGFVEAHGGQIRVNSHDQQGTEFTFTLPLTT